MSDDREKRKKLSKRARKKLLKERKVAKKAHRALGNIPDRFIDDGCSYSPDSMFHNEIGWACRIHDFRYCSRTEAHKDTSPEARLKADKELRANIALSFPKWLGWIRWLYYKAVRRFGSMHAWDSCGPEDGEYCKHNMQVPLWMQYPRDKENEDEHD
jgi:hypothetical protein